MLPSTPRLRCAAPHPVSTRCSIAARGVGGIVTSQGGTLHAVRKWASSRRLHLRGVRPKPPGARRLATSATPPPAARCPRHRSRSPPGPPHSSIAVAHNDLINAEAARHDLEEDGSIFLLPVRDTAAVILQLMARSRAGGFVECLIDALGRVRACATASSSPPTIASSPPAISTAFACFALGRLQPPGPSRRRLRDLRLRFPSRPRRPRAASPPAIFSSTRPASSVQMRREHPVLLCVQYTSYFARPDSVLDDLSVYDARIAMGEQLARETAVPADVVVPVPDSGVVAASGPSPRPARSPPDGPHPQPLRRSHLH